MQREVKVRWDSCSCTLDGTEMPPTNPTEISSQPIEYPAVEPTGASGPAAEEYHTIRYNLIDNEWFIDGVSQGQMKRREDGLS